MGLRDKYQTPTAASTAAADTAPTPDPASELAALRAKLAGRGNVNPPEATIPDDAMQRMTRETADGGAEAIPVSPATDAYTTAIAGPTLSEEAGPSRKPRSKKATSPAAAEAPSAAGVDVAPLDRIATALEALVSVLRSRE